MLSKIIQRFQAQIPHFWFTCDCLSDVIFILDIAVQLRTGYLEQGLMVSTGWVFFFFSNVHNSLQVYDDKKLASHYMRSKNFLLDLAALVPLDLLQLKLGTQPLLRFPRFFKVSAAAAFKIFKNNKIFPFCRFID